MESKIYELTACDMNGEYSTERRTRKIAAMKQGELAWILLGDSYLWQKGIKRRWKLWGGVHLQRSPLWWSPLLGLVSLKSND